MTRRIVLTVALVASLAALSNTAEARNLFNRQADPAQSLEALPIPGPAVQQGWSAPTQKMPTQKMQYQAVQKMPYQAVQKGAYQKGAVATCVRYVQHRPHRKTCCDCGPSYQTVLTVIDPRSCCAIDVPVCLPACCTGQPQCNGRNGLFGRGITSYDWCCGYSVRIVVGHHGDVTVHYYGV
jgi:hypothetical protein